MSSTRTQLQSRTWLFGGAALIVAAGIGFGAARLTATAPTPPPAPAAAEEAAPEAPEGTVAMIPARISAAGIKLTPTVAGVMAAEILMQGSVEAQPLGQAALAARADGVVTRIVKRLGDQVRAGEVIAVIESRDASTIAAERSTANARAVAARQAFEREQRLFTAGISPRQDLEAAQAARAEADAEVRRTTAAAAATRVSADGRSLNVVSPISGSIASAPAVLGAYVTAGTELFRIANQDSVEVRVAAIAADAERLAPGDRAVVEAATGDIAATVRSITPSIDPQSRTATVVLTLDGPTTLRPGQAVRARISPSGSRGGDRIVVPDEAVQSIDGSDAVFIRTPDGFKVQPVVVANRGGGRAEILSGLTAGQTIAGVGAFVLKAELEKGEAEHGH